METQQTYTAHIEHHGEWWIGWILEVSGVTCQERTREDVPSFRKSRHIVIKADLS